MSKTKAKTDFFIWTDDEVELLLQVSLDYKTRRLQEGVDWETCRTKYEDITRLFVELYPKESSSQKDFPHPANPIAKVQVISKLKNVKRNYRKAVDAGRRSGNGRVVHLYFELCGNLWGGSPATSSIEAGIETGDLEGIDELEESSIEAPDAPDSDGAIPDAVVMKKRRDLLQAKLNSHRGDRLKRKLPADQDDLNIKKRMLELMEDTNRQNVDNSAQFRESVSEITSAIKDGFSLMRELFLQPSNNPHPYPHSSGYGHGHGQFYGHPPVNMPSTLHTSTPVVRHTPRPQTAHAQHMTPQYPPRHDPTQSYSFRRALMQEDAE